MRERARWSFWDQEAHLVADSYVAPVQRAGAFAVLLPIDTRRPLTGAPLTRGPRELLDRIDGLMLIGGADVDPATYGAARGRATESTYPDRDRFEVALLHGAIERGLPVLGICRGMQILNVALGGTLEQDTATVDGNNPHRRVVGTFEGNEHTVVVEPGSLAARAVGEEIHLARCHHHQSVLALGDGLVISAHADDDGVPEAIESADGDWVLGVQWHPEADDKSRLFQALRDAAAAYGESSVSGPRTRSAPPVARP